MKPTKAREIAENATRARHQKHIKKCIEWAKAKSDTAIRKRANKGYCSIELKVPKRLNRSSVAEAFAELGYEVTAKTNNRLFIKW